MNNLIFTDDYYLKKILDLCKRVKKDKPLINKIERLTAMILLQYSNFELTQDNIVIYRDENNVKYEYSLEELKEYADIYNHVMQQAKINFSDYTQKQESFEKEIEKIKTEMEKNTAIYKKAAMTDALTGLYNLSKFNEDIQKIKVENITIIMGDVNFLKMTNDTKGHAAGDFLIKTIADKLSEYYPNKVYRVGGDEFYIIADKENEYNIKDKLDQIKSDLNNCVDIINNSISFGYAVGYEKADIEMLKDTAEKRMYKNKIKIKEKMETQYNYIDDRTSPYLNNLPNKNISEEFIYDEHKFEVAQIAYKCIVAPLHIDEDESHPVIFAYIENDKGVFGTFASSKEAPTLKIEFNNEEFIIRGRYINGHFESTVLSAGTTLRSGYKVENDNVTKIAPPGNAISKGHPVLVINNTIIHAIPLFDKNNEDGWVKSLICIEPGESGNICTMVSSKNTAYDNVRIYTYWASTGDYKLEIL